MRPYVFGDFYPLSATASARPTGSPGNSTGPTGEGMVQAFRRQESPDNSLACRLQGLNPNSVYALTNLDVRGVIEMAGRKLMEQGLPVTIPDRPGAAVLTYKRLTTNRRPHFE